MLNFSQSENIGFIYIKDMLSCCSPYGEERVRNMRFFAPGEEDALLCEFDNISRAINAYSCDGDTLQDLEHMLMRLKDVRRSVSECGEGALSEVSLFELKRFLIQLESISELFLKLNSNARFSGIEIPPITEALKILTPDETKTATFYVSDAYSERLAELRRKKRALEHRLRETKDAKSVADIKDERQRIVALEEEEELNIRHELSMRLKPYKDEMLSAIDMIGVLDFTLAKAKLAKAYGANKPIISEAFKLVLTNMVNPQIDDALKLTGSAFTPVSITLERGATVITGANMGGKSVALKTVALNLMLFHAGMFVFAEYAELPLVDHISLISEELEDTKRGLSSFGGEIMRLREEIAYSAGRTLMLFDEFARGTNPEEGAKIVCALIKYLNRQQALSLLTTHYDGVAGHALAHYRVIGLRDFSVEEAIAHGETGVGAIARHMNYGLYKTHDYEPCPRDAYSIVRLLLDGEAILDELLNEYA